MADAPANPLSTTDLDTLQARYADLIVRVGANVQPGQGVSLRAELEHAPFVRRLVAACYRAGARYVAVAWDDDLTNRARLLHSAADDLDYVPPFDVARLRQMLDEGWARIVLVGPQSPTAMDDVDSRIVRRASLARRTATQFYSDATMTYRIAWCIAAVPTVAWAQQVFPELDASAAVAQLWRTILATTRADQPDPAAAWDAHVRQLERVAKALMRLHVRALHFEESAARTDGAPVTDFVVGLTDAPVWVGGTPAQTPQGIAFEPNMPTEEIFTTPHCARVEGFVRTSKPTFPLGQRVEDAWFRFKAGAVIEYGAAVGKQVLDEFFQIPGAQRLGEIALVDERSPVNQAGRVFYEILFDENCACHMAFGEAYPEGVEHGMNMTPDERAAAGINSAQTHVDFMIGTPTLRVTGITADAHHIPIMENGRFVDGLLDDADE